jgi:hypothetical protein
MATKIPKDPKQLLHIRIEQSLVKALDKYSKKSKWTRSMSVRRIIQQWAEGQ